MVSLLMTRWPGQSGERSKSGHGSHFPPFVLRIQPPLGMNGGAGMAAAKVSALTARAAGRRLIPRYASSDPRGVGVTCTHPDRCERYQSVVVRKRFGGST